MLSLSFDNRSLSEITAMVGFSVFLSDEMVAAMQQAGVMLQQAAVANTWAVFANPSGQLADSIQPLLDSPFEVQIGVGVPYGARREYGFSGMTDSLGRYYTSDPGKPYLQPALDDNQQQVLALIESAVMKAMERMGVRF